MTNDTPPRPAALIFGYGSLLDPRSIARTLPAFPGHGHPLLPALLDGWKRTWTAVLPNWSQDSPPGADRPDSIAYMNVEPEPGAIATGVVFPVTPGEFDALRARESIYTPVDVTDRIRYPAARPARDWNGLPVLTFTAASPWRADGNWGTVAIRADYRELIRRASRALDQKWDLEGLLERDFDAVNAAHPGFHDMPPPPDGRYT